MLVGNDCDENSVTLTVNFVEHLGDASVIYANLRGEATSIAVKLTTDTANIKAGSVIQVQLPALRCHLFDASGIACSR